MSATYTFAAATTNHATAASQAKYGNMTSFAGKMLVKGDALRLSVNYTSRFLWLFDDRGDLRGGFYRDPDSSPARILFQFTDTQSGLGITNFATPLEEPTISASAWYVVYWQRIPEANGMRHTVFEVDGTELATYTLTGSPGTLPNAGAGNGILRVGNNGTVAHTWTLGGFAIYDAALSGADRYSVPTTADANILGLYIADAGSGSTIDDDTGGTALTISGSGTWNTESNPWADTPPATATKLLFTTQPANTAVGSTMASFVVSATDAGDVVDTAYVADIVLTDTPTDYTGTKTKAAVAGVATFDNIVPQKILSATTITATSGALTSATSSSFNITAPTGGVATYTEADMQTDIRARGATSQIGEVLILTSAAAPATGLLHNTSGFTCFAGTDAAAPAAVTLADMTLGTYASAGFKEIDATNRPGWYAFGYPPLPASGAYRSFTFKGTGLRNATLRVELTGSDPRGEAVTTAGIADGLLNRSIAGGADGGRTVEQALAAIRNRVAIVGTTMTVYDVDDTTPLYTATITGTPSVTESDPA